MGQVLGDDEGLLVDRLWPFINGRLPRAVLIRVTRTSGASHLLDSGDIGGALSSVSIEIAEQGLLPQCPQPGCRAFEGHEKPPCPIG